MAEVLSVYLSSSSLLLAGCDTRSIFKWFLPNMSLWKLDILVCSQDNNIKGIFSLLYECIFVSSCLQSSHKESQTWYRSVWGFMFDQKNKTKNKPQTQHFGLINLRHILFFFFFFFFFFYSLQSTWLIPMWE